MSEIQQQRQNEITAWLKGKKIMDVRYYLMNREGYLHPDSALQLVDAGIELQLDDESFISFGWNFEYSILDMYKMRFVDKLRSFNTDLRFLEIAATNDLQWKEVLGKSVNEIRFAWNWFIDMDEKTHYVPQDIELLLSDNTYVAICTTSYNVDEEGISILEPDSEGELLVIFNEEDTKFYKRGSYYVPAENTGIEPNFDEEYGGLEED
jgi:hypothetical protein